MLTKRVSVSAALAAALVAASSMGAGATAAAPSRSEAAAAQATRTGTAGGAHEFVVSYQGGTAAGVAAIEAAGGTVVDVTEEVGLALVSAPDDSFLREVRGEAAVTGAARNQSVGLETPDLPHRYVEERPAAAERQAAATRPGRHGRTSSIAAGEPLAGRQWDMAMIGATPTGAHRRATGRGVDVGIIDTGIDGSHPDLAPNFDAERSRNFTIDMPDIDGPCEVATCIDPADVDDGGHGTHVAGIVAAARNAFGIGGVAPDATLVNLRAGQDSGYFFMYETVAALVESGNLGLDVVNMSFYTDPWLYNCESADDYLSGAPTDEEIAEQSMIRSTVLAALDYAHGRGVTLVAAAGNGFTDLAAPERFDDSSPDYPADAAVERTVTDNCLDLPSEGPDVISVSSVGPSTTKSDFSNYGLGDVEVAAPGGWFRDYVGTDAFSTPQNMVLSSYPLDLAIEEGLVDEDGVPVDDFSVQYCNSRGTCGVYTYLQGTSMASPHAAGVAALVIEAHGRGDRNGYSLAPDTVRSIIERTATDHPCPAGGVEVYTDEGRPPEWNAACEGTTAENGLYGEGIVSATAAVARR
jgi:subtilisin family serine protease